jgi:hypothetical protein
LIRAVRQRQKKTDTDKQQDRVLKEKKKTKKKKKKKEKKRGGISQPSVSHNTQHPEAESSLRSKQLFSLSSNYPSFMEPDCLIYLLT